MSKESDRLLMPIMWSFEGKNYNLSVCTCDVELQFSRWLAMSRRDKIKQCREEFGEDYFFHMNRWQQRFEAEEYEWTGYIADSVRRSEVGKKKLLQLMFSAAGNDPGPDMIDRIFSCPEAMVELFNEETGEGTPPRGLYWRSVDQGRPTYPATKNSEPVKPNAQSA